MEHHHHHDGGSFDGGGHHHSHHHHHHHSHHDGSLAWAGFVGYGVGQTPIGGGSSGSSQTHSRAPYVPAPDTLYAACRCGDLAAVQGFVTKTDFVYSADINGDYPLDYALRYPVIVQWLLSEANPHHAAARSHISDKTLRESCNCHATLKILLDAGANPGPVLKRAFVYQDFNLVAFALLYGAIPEPAEAKMIISEKTTVTKAILAYAAQGKFAGKFKAFCYRAGVTQDQQEGSELNATLREAFFYKRYGFFGTQPRVDDGKSCVWRLSQRYLELTVAVQPAPSATSG